VRGRVHRPLQATSVAEPTCRAFSRQPFTAQKQKPTQKPFHECHSPDLASGYRPAKPNPFVKTKAVVFWDCSLNSTTWACVSGGKRGIVDDFVWVKPTGFNKLAHFAVDSKGLPLGQPTGPEPDNANTSKQLITWHFQVVSNQWLLLNPVEVG
jgi:hypothetical protein